MWLISKVQLWLTTAKALVLIVKKQCHIQIDVSFVNSVIYQIFRDFNICPSILGLGTQSMLLNENFWINFDNFEKTWKIPEGHTQNCKGINSRSNLREKKFQGQLMLKLRQATSMLKNPAFGRHRLSKPMRIHTTTTKKLFCGSVFCCCVFWPLKCRWNAIEVLLKCHRSAEEVPTAKSHSHRPSPAESTITSKKGRVNALFLWEQTDTLFFNCVIAGHY